MHGVSSQPDHGQQKLVGVDKVLQVFRVIAQMLFGQADSRIGTVSSPDATA
jgi:hypothetical protein